MCIIPHMTWAGDSLVNQAENLLYWPFICIFLSKRLLSVPLLQSIKAIKYKYAFTLYEINLIMIDS